MQRNRKQCGVRRVTAFLLERNRTAKERVAKKHRHALRPMIGERVHPDLPPRFAPQRRYIVQRKNVPPRLFNASLKIKNGDRMALASPRPEPFSEELFAKGRFIRGQGNRFGGEQACGLVVTV